MSEHPRRGHRRLPTGRDRAGIGEARHHAEARPDLPWQEGARLLEDDPHLVHEALARMIAQIDGLTERGMPSARAYDETALEMYDAWPAALAAVFVFLQRWEQARAADRLDDLTRHLSDRCPYCPPSFGPPADQEEHP